VVDEEPTAQQPDGAAEPPSDPWPAAETGQDPTVPDRTDVLSPADQPGTATARWSARAGVPAGPRPAVQEQEQEQEWVPPVQPRTWWTPILIGLVIVVLLGLISLGLALAMHGSGPAPASTGGPTSAVPSSPAPTTVTSSAPVALVPVPALANIAISDALPILQGVGLTPKVVNEVNRELPPGTVIRTDPPAGTQVRLGSTVTVVVATAPATPSPPPSAPSPSGSGQ
jgi:hypothetical protein